MRIAILKERHAGETRVAATPETVKKFVGAGHEVAIEKGAGVAAAIPDDAFAEAGATIGTAAATLKGAEALFGVRTPDEATLAKLKGVLLVCHLEPHGNTAKAEALAKAGIDALAMEFVPRITRAQAMDALSSQANLAGYRSVIEAAELYGRAFPMMMTAAGTVAPAKAFVMGVGVAGLQAIATARRLGAVVTATDVRPAVKEQVASLGAKFIAVEDAEFKPPPRPLAGYAKEMSEAYQPEAGRALVAEPCEPSMDIVITTALIPGRPGAAPGQPRRWWRACGPAR